MKMDSNKNSDGVKNKPISDEERLALCQKLDKELDEFIDKLPKRNPTDGLAEDKWQEEIENHPFFMKKLPEAGEELHPLYEGLQKLKYDPEENTPDELAISYKEDGNFNFKHKNYRLAILSYTEGIKAKSNNQEMNATLYNNRAAANYFLKNYRSSLRDCELALKFKENYDKVLIRAANCCFHTENFDKCMEYCDNVLDKDSDNRDIQQLRQKCMNASKLKERDLRRREMLYRKKGKEERLLLDTIVSRNLRFDFPKGAISLDKLQPQIPQFAHNRVHLDDSNNLLWPVTFVYPEYEVMDFMTEFDELRTFVDTLSVLFEGAPYWDVENKYKTSALNVYFENDDKKLFKINVNDDLKTVLSHKEYTIKCGSPSFIVLLSGTLAEKTFLEKYKFVESSGKC